MYNFDNKFQSFVYAVVTNKELSEDERSKIIADFFEEFRESYPNLEHAVTKHELTESELRLTKEIEATRKEIKELDAAKFGEALLEIAAAKKRNLIPRIWLLKLRT